MAFEKYQMCTFEVGRRESLKLANIRAYCSKGNTSILSDNRLELPKVIESSDHTFSNVAKTLNQNSHEIAPLTEIIDSDNKRAYTKNEIKNKSDGNKVALKVNPRKNYLKKKKKPLSNDLRASLTKLDETDKSIGNKVSKVSQKSLSFREILDNDPMFKDKDKHNEMEANEIFDKAAKFYEQKRAAELGSQRKPEYVIDWNSAMAMVKETEAHFPPQVISR